MTTMSISLPDELKQLLDEHATKTGYRSPSEYIEALVREDLRLRAQEMLEQKLIHGLNSGPPKEITDQDWEDMRKRLIERHQSRPRP